MFSVNRVQLPESGLVSQLQRPLLLLNHTFPRGGLQVSNSVQLLSAAGANVNKTDMVHLDVMKLLK